MTSLQRQGVNMRDRESQLWLLWQLIGRVFGNSKGVAAHLLEKALDPWDGPTNHPTGGLQMPGVPGRSAVAWLQSGDSPRAA